MEQLQASSDKKIPDSAAAIFARNETFRQLLGNLDITTCEYNRILETVVDVEQPLIHEDWMPF